MAINTELLLGTLQHIDVHRGDWYQAEWRGCFAGHAAILSGGQWAVKDPYHALHYLLKPVREDRRQDVGVYGADDGWDGKPLRGVHVQKRAARLLGLDSEQARRLFWSANTLPRLYTIVSDLCEEAEVAA